MNPIVKTTGAKLAWEASRRGRRADPGNVATPITEYMEASARNASAVPPPSMIQPMMLPARRITSAPSVA